jgi:ABC-type uncharacterized transport system substrate-binding protein
MAVDLVRQNVDVIVAGGPEPNLNAATEATRTIPIVMVALNRGPYQRAADYGDRIFRGARPADLPIEQPTKYELVINLGTAKTLGLTIPPSVLLRADRVVE